MPDVPVEAIAEALRKATPGDHWWTDDYQDEDGRYNVWAAQDPNRDSSNGVITSYGGPSFEDAHLIANAPTWLAQLLAALEASERENERLTGALREIAYSPKTLPMGIRPLARAALATAPNTKDGEG